MPFLRIINDKFNFRTPDLKYPNPLKTDALLTFM